jgi:hypothetical protein
MKALFRLAICLPITLALPVQAADNPARVRLDAICTMTIEPEMAVIVAGFSAKGYKAVDVSAQLDKVAAELEKRAMEFGGKNVLKDRLRGANTLALRDREDRPPITMVQLVEIQIPLKVEIDRALDALLPLGLDRFGPNIGLAQTNEIKPVVHYRVVLHESLFDACKRKAVEYRCSNSSLYERARKCDIDPDRFEHCLRVDSVRLSDRTFYQSIEWPESKSADRLGKGPFELNGLARFSYMQACLTE